jgi:hypothetical protein
MKALLILSVILTSQFSHAQTRGESVKTRGTTPLAAVEIKPATPPVYLERLSRLYASQNQGPELLQKRVEIAKSEGLFQLWRSFPPYYYDLLNRHPAILSTSRSGMCAGDAHAENFGFIHVTNAKGESPVFTVNDMDDMVKCNLDADLLRLIISHRMAGTKLTTEQILAAYAQGIAGKQKCEEPAYIKKLRKNADAGTTMKEDYLSGCPDDETLVSGEEAEKLKTFHLEECQENDLISSVAKETFAFACTQTKLDGGSAGEKRYTIVLSTKLQGSPTPVNTSAYELKPLVRSASEAALNLGAPRDDVRRQGNFEKAVLHNLGENGAAHYQPKVFEGKLYQKRPHWEGNKGVKLKKIPAEQLDEVLSFESCVLGNFHARSVAPELRTFSYDAGTWEKRSLEVMEKFKAEFGL